VFLEDVYECLPLAEVEEFYNFFIKNLLVIPVVGKSAGNRCILKICNNLLKRLSKSTFCELRGK